MKYLKFYLIFFIITCCISVGSSQFLKEYDHTIGYFGNTFINPGLMYGLETPVWDSDYKENLIIPFGRTKIYASGQAGFYWDPFSHVGVLNYYEFGLRQYLGKRLAVQFGLGPGVQLNFTNDNYIFNDDFELKKRSLKMNSYFAPEISSAICLSNKAQTRTVISKVSLFILSPYNSFVLPVFNYELMYQF